MSSGYHQVSIHEDSRDIFSIILPSGKYRYCTLPQGASVSSDYFNICTDDDIRGMPGMYKNIDDVLITGNDMEKLEERLEKMLKVCERKNMKLNPE